MQTPPHQTWPPLYLYPSPPTPTRHNAGNPQSLPRSPHHNNKRNNNNNSSSYNNHNLIDPNSYPLLASNLFLHPQVLPFNYPIERGRLPQGRCPPLRIHMKWFSPPSINPHNSNNICYRRLHRDLNHNPQQLQSSPHKAIKALRVASVGQGGLSSGGVVPWDKQCE